MATLTHERRHKENNEETTIDSGHISLQFFLSPLIALLYGQAYVIMADIFIVLTLLTTRTVPTTCKIDCNYTLVTPVTHTMSYFLFSKLLIASAKQM